MIKCPICELNYVNDGEDVCEVCRPSKQVTYKIKKGNKTITLIKTKEKSNIAFKCNYCDGGKNDNRIGFAGACSVENIRENIDLKKHIWCKDSDCKCKQWQSGQFPYKELNINSLCYESRSSLIGSLKLVWIEKKGIERGDVEDLEKMLKMAYVF